MRVYAEGTDVDAVSDLLDEGRALVERFTP